MDFKKNENGFSYIEIVLSVIILITLSFFAIKLYFGLDNLKAKALAKDYGKQIITTSNEIIYSCDNIDSIRSNNFYYDYDYTEADDIFTLQKKYIVNGNELLHSIVFTPIESNIYNEVTNITFNETNDIITKNGTDVEAILYDVKNYLFLGDNSFPRVDSFFVLKKVGESYEN